MAQLPRTQQEELQKPINNTAGLSPAAQALLKQEPADTGAAPQLIEESPQITGVKPVTTDIPVQEAITNKISEYDDISERYTADKDLVNATLSPAARALLEFPEVAQTQITTTQEGIEPAQAQPAIQQTEITKETGDEASVLGTLASTGSFILEKAGWALRPLGAIQAAAIAPIGQKERIAEVERKKGTIASIVEALKVSGEAAVGELFPESGTIRPEFEKEALEATGVMEQIPEGLRPTAEIATAILTDPAVLAFPFKKAIQEGLETAVKTGQRPGIFRNALEEAVSFVSMSPEDTAKAAKLAVKADKGNKKAAQKLADTMSEASQKQAQVDIEPMKKRLNQISGISKKPIVKILEDQKVTEKFLQESEGLPKKAININFNRIKAEDDIKNVISKTAELFKDDINVARRGKVSFEETQKLADDLGLKPETLLARRQGQAFNAEEAIAARQILVASGERLKEMAQLVKSRDATDLDKFEFQKQLATHYALQSQVSGLTAEAGRALSAFRIQSKSTAAQLKQIDELMRSLPKGVKPEDMAEMLTSIDTVSGLNTAVRQARKATIKDMLYSSWINGLLSGLPTHAVNMTSNLLVALYAIPERLFAAGISKITGEASTKGGEALHQTYGLIEGFKDGLKAFLKVVKTGEAQDVVSKLEIPFERAITAQNLKDTIIGRPFAKTLDKGGMAARAVDLLGAFIELPGRFLQAEDSFFKSIGYRMELRAQAYRQAVSEGLQGDAAAKRIQDILNAPDELAPEVHAAAIDAARYQTFTQELGQTGRAFQKTIASQPFLRIIVPFIRTPTNILKYAMERTPLAPLSKRIREDIMAGGTRRDMALARMSLGSVVMGAVASYASAGFITGGGPTEPRMKGLLRNTGWQPYSIKVGDKYYAYSRLEPVGMMFGLAADSAEIMGQLEETEAEDLATAIISSVTKNVTSKTWLRGVSEVIKALDDPDRSALRYVQNLAGTVVPTGVAQVERLIDPEIRSIRTVMDAVKQRVPGYSDDLPPRRNFWGVPIVMPAGLGPDIISPIYVSNEKYSPIDKELFRQENPMAMPRKVQNLNGVEIELEPNEYDQYILNINAFKPDGTKKLKDFLDNAVEQKWFKEYPDEMKEVYVDRIIAGAKQFGKAKLIDDNPVLQQIIVAKKQERLQELQNPQLQQ